MFCFFFTLCTPFYLVKVGGSIGLVVGGGTGEIYRLSSTFTQVDFQEGDLKVFGEPAEDHKQSLQIDKVESLKGLKVFCQGERKSQV